MSSSTKNKVRDWIENKFNCLHKITDKLPLGILDGILHGTSRGIINFLTDNHPKKQEPSNINPNIIKFFEIFENTEFWKQKYPLRFQIFYNECINCRSLEDMFSKFLQGWKIQHQELGSLIFRLTEEQRSKYLEILSHQDELKKEIGKQSSIIEKLGVNEQKILEDLELISNKLKLLDFNRSQDLKSLRRDIELYLLQFNKEIVEVKTQLNQISKDVKVVKATTSDTNTRVKSIETLTNEVYTKQEELKQLILQVLGKN